MKQFIGLDTGTVVFTPGGAGAGTLVFSAVTDFNAARVMAVTNVTRKALIYVPEAAGKGGAWTSLSATGGTLTLDADTAAHNGADILRVIYEDGDALPLTAFTEKGALSVGTINEKFKDGFSTIDADKWTKVQDSSHLVFTDGNVAGSNWIDINLPIQADATETETIYTSRTAFKPPYIRESGLGISQRFFGQEMYAEMVAVDAKVDGTVLSTNTQPADNALTGNVVVATNVWTLTATSQTNTYLRVGDWVYVHSSTDSRLNYGPVMVSAIGTTANNVLTFTGAGLADASYPVLGAMLRVICRCGFADYHHGMGMWGSSNSNVDSISRNGVLDAQGTGNRPRVVPWNPGNTQLDSAVPSEGINYSGSSYTRSFRSKGVWRTEHVTGSLLWVTKDQDSTTGQRSSSFRESEIPAQDKYYALRYRARKLKNQSGPVGSSLAITAISKAGTTTWTVTCPSHGLSTNSRVRLYGMLDQVNFPNLTADTQVAGITDANTFTIVSTTGTASSYGGSVVLVHGGQVPTISTIVAQTYNRSYDSLRLVLVGSGTWTETIGNVVTVCGLVTVGGVVQTALQGRYRVARISTTTLELEPLDGSGQVAAVAAAPAGATACGGAVIRNTSFRLHYDRVIDYNRLLTEASNAHGLNARSAAVHMTNTAALNLSQIVAATVSSMLPGGSTNRALVAALAASGTNTDYSAQNWASATGTGSTISNEIGMAAAFDVNLTAWTAGSSTGLDIFLQWSPDNAGGAWYDLWQCQALTAVSRDWIPPLAIPGRRRFRYVNRGGAATTATVTITASTLSYAPVRKFQFFDRTANLLNGTLSATSASYNCSGCSIINARVSLGATTTPGTYQIQISDDGSGWCNVGTPTAAVANAITNISVTGVIARNCRVIVTGAGTTQVGNYVAITGSE